MTRFVPALGAAVLGASLLAIPAGVFAQSSHGTVALRTAAKARAARKAAKPFVAGTLTARDTSSLTITTATGAVTVKLTAKTHFKGVGTAAQTAGLQVND
jgi:hypothetical protein